MIQARCPECGFVQTLSEKRFLAIPQDLLQCPHCESLFPKQWSPEEPETLREDDKLKMTAYANRIVSSPQISPEIIYALESMVRRYGPVEGSFKALGIGCARLGEYDRAKDYLTRARHEDPLDTELASKLLEVFLAREEFREAENMGAYLMETLGDRTEAEDVARLILAHIGSGNIDKAQLLVESRPDLDTGRPFVRQAKKQLYKASGAGFVSLLGILNPLEKVTALRRRPGIKHLSERAARLLRRDGPPGVRSREGAESDQFGRLEEIEYDSENQPLDDTPQEVISRMEYWIYSRDNQLPKWEPIKNAFEGELGPWNKKQEAVSRLNTMIDDGLLKIDKFLREDAGHLFDFTDEFLKEKSRGFQERDTRSLSQARMLVRVRLSCPAEESLESLFTLIHLVEAIRRLTAGMVQDMASHTIWGAWEWRDTVVSDPLKDLLDIHVRLETLDEGGSVWIHTHGMQKFGYPELEMENIPSEFIAAAQKMALLLARTLLDLTPPTADFREPLKIPGSGFMVAFDSRPPDDEGHFPMGSVRALPYVADYDPYSADTLKHALRMFTSKMRPSEAASRPSAPQPRAAQPPPPQPRPGLPDIRARLLEAHREARNSLVNFKERFRIGHAGESEIFAVKVGFPSPAGDYEWMWVSLDEWRGSSLVGRLQNCPELRKDLEKGNPVNITEAQIFDWAVISRDQGIVQGAFTESVMSDQRMSAIN
jgi:uncharacterized protein YegJ (DUF2314 family)